MTTTDPTCPLSPRHLLTREQVLAALREERGMHGLTVTANRYSIPVQQLCDVLSIPSRKKLSKKMLEALKIKLWEFYEKVGG
jgi:hypothetical protein